MSAGVAVVVTHRRPDELAKSLDVLTTQSRLPDQLIVVDNDDDDRVRDLVAGQPIPTTYLPSRRNLGGAGGFALGMLHALAAGRRLGVAGRRRRPPAGQPKCWRPCWRAPRQHRLAEVSPMVCNADDPQRLAFPLRRGLVWRRRVNELRTATGPGSAAGHRVAVQRRAVPGVDVRVDRCSRPAAVRPRRRGGDAPPAGPVRAAVRHLLERGLSAPCGSAEFKPILGGPDAHAIPRRCDQAVLHLPQSRLPAVATGSAQAAGPGMAAVRLVLPGVPP